METVIDAMFKEYENIDRFFTEKKEISYKLSVQTHLRKGLLLATASYFESIITDVLKNFFLETSNGNTLIISFLQNKALKRQYHTLFAWDDKKGYSMFFGLLGETFKTYMNSSIKTNPTLQKALEAFLEIGAERNRLVHLNYATYDIYKSVEEIHTLYIDALYFVNNLHKFLRLQEL